MVLKLVVSSKSFPSFTSLCCSFAACETRMNGEQRIRDRMAPEEIQRFLQDNIIKVHKAGGVISCLHENFSVVCK